MLKRRLQTTDCKLCRPRRPRHLYRHLFIALNMLMMAMYFVGLK